MFRKQALVKLFVLVLLCIIGISWAFGGNGKKGPQKILRPSIPKEVLKQIESGVKSISKEYPLDVPAGRRLILAFSVALNPKSRYTKPGSIDITYLISLSSDKAERALLEKNAQGGHIHFKTLALREISSFELAGLPYLCAKLNSPNSKVRQLAAGCADNIMIRTNVFKKGKPEEQVFCSAILHRYIYDTDSNMRMIGASMLGKFNRVSAIPELVKLLEDDVLGVRQLAANSLKKLGRSDLVPEGLLEGLILD